MHKLVVLGVDGLDPDAVQAWLGDLPNLQKMQQEGVWGRIESTVPPAGPQAWISSRCGRNPGAYGLWGDTFRKDFTYDESESANSKVIDERVDCLYKLLPKMGQKVSLINVPITWPPPEIHGGYCVSGSVGKRAEGGFTWPESLQQEVDTLVGEYLVDPFCASPNHRLTDTDEIVQRIYQMDTQRWRLLRHFIQEKRCDYVLTVLNGIKFIYGLVREQADPDDSDLQIKHALHDYYTWVDLNLGQIRGSFDDDTVLIVYSPYSLKRSEGHVNLNEWLIHRGYLALHEYPEKPTAFKYLNVDWANTKCWSIGNSGKITINLKGREPQGIVAPDAYDTLLDDLRAGISEVRDDHGQFLGVQVWKREAIHFGDYEAYGPDLFIHIDKVPWNTNDWVGYGLGKIVSSGQQEGLGGEYGGMHGYFCLSGSDVPVQGELKGISVLHIPPTGIDVLRLEIPMEMEKPSIFSVAERRKKKSPGEREERVRSRLKALGY
jgi:predicted AlkP superfamily phosphohydrolase/phosphomutase